MLLCTLIQIVVVFFRMAALQYNQPRVTEYGTHFFLSLSTFLFLSWISAYFELKLKDSVYDPRHKT